MFDVHGRINAKNPGVIKDFLQRIPVYKMKEHKWIENIRKLNKEYEN
jgi:hypothetical protein